MSLVRDIETKIHNLEHTKIEKYGKDIQVVLDHFGAGKLKGTEYIYCISVAKNYVPIGVVNTSKGTFFFIELSTSAKDRDNILEFIDSKLDLQNPSFAHAFKKGVRFAHVEGLYFALRSL